MQGIAFMQTKYEKEPDYPDGEILLLSSNLDITGGEDSDALKGAYLTLKYIKIL